MTMFFLEKMVSLKVIFGSFYLLDYVNSHLYQVVRQACASACAVGLLSHSLRISHCVNGPYGLTRLFLKFVQDADSVTFQGT